MKTQVTSEFGELRKVLIHTPGLELERGIPWEGEHAFLQQNAVSLDEMLSEHNVLKAFLVSEIGAENVLTVSQLLADVFANVNGAQRQEILQDIMGSNDNGRLERYLNYLQAHGLSLEDYPAAEIAADLIEGCPRPWEVTDGRVTGSIIPPKPSLMWTRDSAAVTPVGVIVSAMAKSQRKEEPALIRAIFKHHPQFGEDSIVLDLLGLQRDLAVDPSIALAWDYIIEGGNLLVLSEETLAIGVGKRTFEYSKRANRLAFEFLVKELFQADKARKIQRVYLVNLPDLRGFIHLDTVFNMFGPKAAIAMPYIFGHPFSYEEVFVPLIRCIRQDLAGKKVDLQKLPTVEDFERAGKVEIYAREVFDRTGEVGRLPVESKYLLDQLVKDGILDLNNVVWVGGDPGDHPNPVEHLRVALREQINQAGNVFTVKPFRAIAYHRNPHTLAALEAKMQVLSPIAHLERIPSNELRTNMGGPHCLTMPLERTP